ncbi:hypothetical protein HPB52_018082 [Rhipicephalus sanguineus]|uniref:Reverse transcriptase domain-containing protein n=1 Tax=Rhipicephalus sanguineus TaxID=34632 RepID=A0A9D4Q1R5_RHISA|nr:hypothetical protein HPB52_018082 [Rhipicephalus sanguineus]
MSWIEITLATPSMLIGGHSWHVREDVTHSEHRYIVITIGEVTYGNATRDPWFDQVTHTQVQSAEALDRLALERKRVNASRRRFQRCKDDALRVMFRAQYSELLAAFRRATAQARESYMRGFCAECTRKSIFSTPYNQAFGKVRADQVLPPLVRPDGSYTATHLESASLLLQTQIAVDDRTTGAPPHRAIRPYTSACRITHGFRTSHSHARSLTRSAPGPDDLSPPIVKGLARVQGHFLLWLLNSAMRLGHFPSQWKRVRIIFIRKPVLGKVLERLLNGRLCHFMLQGGHVHQNQYGFTHGKSAVLALHRLHGRLVCLKREKTPVILMSLDFQGAFDSVRHPLVLQFFRDRGLTSRLYHLLRTFLTDRTVTFTSHAGQAHAQPFWAAHM